MVFLQLSLSPSVHLKEFLGKLDFHEAILFLPFCHFQIMHFFEIISQNIERT